MAGLWEMLKYSRTIHKQCRPAEPTFSVDQIPDLSGKVVIVTGAHSAAHEGVTQADREVLTIGGNSGIGRETVKVCRFFIIALGSSLSSALDTRSSSAIMPRSIWPLETRTRLVLPLRS